jgi:hypothetical protein
MLLKLLLAPVTAPMTGFRLLLNQMRTMAEDEVYDVDKLHSDLIALQLQVEEGEITEEAYAQREADLIVRIRAARERSLGQGVK